MSKLQDELLIDPLNRGYASLTDKHVLANMRLKNRIRLRKNFSKGDVMRQVVKSDFDVLTPIQEELFWNVIHLDNLGPSGLELEILTTIFGTTSTTTENLNTAKNETVTRIEELVLGNVKVGHIHDARL